MESAFLECFLYGLAYGVLFGGGAVIISSAVRYLADIMRDRG